MNRTRTTALAASAAFVACIVLANLATSWWGLVPIGLGLAVTAGTFAAGAALLARDVVQDTAGRWAVVGLVAAGAGISYLTGEGRIAVASAVAFAVGELLDMAVYTPLRDRSWTGAVIASNAVGGVVDTILFLTIAGFGLTGGALAGQWLVKMAVTLAVVALVGGARAVRSDDVRADRA